MSINVAAQQGNSKVHKSKLAPLQQALGKKFWWYEVLIL